MRDGSSPSAYPEVGNVSATPCNMAKLTTVALTRRVPPDAMIAMVWPGSAPSGIVTGGGGNNNKKAR